VSTITTYEGKLSGKGLRFGLVVGRFNELIAQHLLDGALDNLRRHEVADGDIEIAWVPGAFEMPLVARRLADSGRYDAVVCLGAVIRGGTPHFEYVAAEAAKGIARAGLDSGVPVAFGVLTTDTIEQAVERAGTKAGNKGFAAATTALEMANLMRTLPAEAGATKKKR
jgi:6,7-dimethyl-8-ribityllumazine synthase